MSAPVKSKLVLFDIDGTLLTSGGAGEGALSLAAKEQFGVEDSLEGIEIAGRTDSGIARQIFARHGVEPTPENVGAFFDRYLRHLERQLPMRPGTLLNGVVELLQALRDRTEVSIALLTGNLSRGAQLKLEHYGVWEFFEFGAFADDHHDRNALGPFAQRRALERHGVEFAPQETYVIGDTPHDIDCGRAFGARTLAIATGRYSVEELEAHGPDQVFSDLSDIAAVLRALGL